ncbi:helix-turn-helix domain-containing protein [Achromobacter xylosoxidans]
MKADLQKRMLSWLQDHCNDPALTALRLAKAFQVSIRQVHIVFNGGAAHGSFLRALQYIRMKRASDLLTDSQFINVPVKQLGRFCGYSDFGAFSETFKRHFGTTPAEYRRRQQAESYSRPRHSVGPGRVAPALNVAPAAAIRPSTNFENAREQWMDMNLLTDYAANNIRLQKRGYRLERPEPILTLMRTYNWTLLRAWRSWLSYSQEVMAVRLGIAPATYAQLELGEISLCEWTEPEIACRLAALGPSMNTRRPEMPKEGIQAAPSSASSKPD